MAYRVVFSPEADAHLVALYRYIATEVSPAIAQRFTEAIVDYCEGFGAFPHRGTQHDDLRPGLRTVGFRRQATIAFTVEKDAVTILGVFYGGRDYEAALRDNQGP